MIKRIVLFIFKKLFYMVGYEFIIFNKNRNSIVTINKNKWIPFALNNKKMELYFEGLRQSENEQADGILKQLRFYNLQQLVHYVLQKKIEGDFVECGVWKGHSAYLISKIISKSKFNRRFHIFDAFEGGLSKKVENDISSIFPQTEEGNKKQSIPFRSTEIQVQQCLKDYDFVSLYKGWIPSRFSEVENCVFSFIHIDVDLYEPTLDSLNFFFHRLTKGGVIVCDDYGSSHFPGAKKAFDEFLKDKEYHMFYEVPMGACFLIK